MLGEWICSTASGTPTARARGEIGCGWNGSKSPCIFSLLFLPPPPLSEYDCVAVRWGCLSGATASPRGLLGLPVGLNSFQFEIISSTAVVGLGLVSPVRDRPLVGRNDSPRCCPSRFLSSAAGGWVGRGRWRCGRKGWNSYWASVPWDREQNKKNRRQWT